MRHIVLLAAALLIVVGSAVAKFSDNILDPKAAMSNAAAKPAITRVMVAAPAGELTLTRGDGGHFHADARVDGRSGIHFVVDTGASMIALRESDAARIGHRPPRGDYTQKISTANGDILAARVMLDKVEIGDITVRDVSAVILPDEALSVNLLGMTYLSKLKRFEYAGGKLVLAQ